MTRAEMAEIAMRYETSMSRAMLRAVGADALACALSRAARATERGGYDGVGWGVANHGSPMDGLR